MQHSAILLNDIPHSKRKSKSHTPWDLYFQREGNISLPVWGGLFQSCIFALLSPLKLSSVRSFLHAPVFNFYMPLCCQKGYQANVFNVWGRKLWVKASARFNLCFGMIQKCILAICLELTGWTGKLALLLRQEWPPLFTGEKWQQIKHGCRRAQIELLGTFTLAFVQ